MRLLVTRAAADAVRLAERLEAHGHEVVLEPLITIVPLSFTLPSGPIAAFVLTSRHAAWPLAASAANMVTANAAVRRPVCCVGAATAAAARAAGLGNVVAARGDAAALVARLADTIDPAAGALVHVRGRHVTAGLADTLRGRGFRVDEVIAYEAEAATSLSPRTRAALRDGALDGVLLMSPRTARIFARLVADAGLGGAAAGTTAYCLSKAVADALDGLAMPIAIAGRPDLESLLGLVG